MFFYDYSLTHFVLQLNTMASIAGLYGGFGTNQEDGGGGRQNLFSKFKKDIIKVQATAAAAKREM